MNVDITVTVNEEITASKRSWMAAHSKYPTVLVYDIQSKKFFDQIAYKPGFQLSTNNAIGGSSYNIPKEFRLQFYLTLAAPTSQSSDTYLNILTLKENGVNDQKRAPITIGLSDEQKSHATFQLSTKLFPDSDQPNVPSHTVSSKKAVLKCTFSLTLMSQCDGHIHVVEPCCNAFQNYNKQKYVITQELIGTEYFTTFSIDGEILYHQKNPSPNFLYRMKIFMSKDWYTSALGEVEHFMLTTPSCESKAPEDWDKMEVNWNTFIYYKKFDDQKTRNDAKDFCRTQGRIYFDSNST